jgi:hypothetical protein
MKKTNKQPQSFESYINDIPLVINPCRLCVNCTKVCGDITTHLTENCKDCCYFYDSKFKVKEVKNDN